MNHNIHLYQKSQAERLCLRLYVSYSLMVLSELLWRLACDLLECIGKMAAGAKVQIGGDLGYEHGGVG